MDTLRAFAVEPAKNGGLVVSEQFSKPGYGCIPEIIGAFSTPADMITWLAGQYGLAASVAVPDGFLVTDGLCHDEGCPHHDTPHVCIDWTPWEGGECPVPGALVEVKFRDGSSHDEPHAAKNYRWSRTGSSTDIVGYRVV